MRLPQPLLDSQFFQFSSLAELLKATGELVPPSEQVQMRRMVDRGLPPITSRAALSAMLGINPGLTHALITWPQRYYRTFEIPKGRRGIRRIDAPRVGLKIIQKWVAERLQNCYERPEHVYGFVPGLSHVHAAAQHCEATWTFGVDIKDFFQTTPIKVVVKCLLRIGFDENGAGVVASLCCLNGVLAQGAPSSPVLSNICFLHVDQRLTELAAEFGVRLTRYADDIVFSGMGEFPERMQTELFAIFSSGPWRLSERKTRLDKLPNRLKVHGLLVHGERARLTKGYRNRLRAYDHLERTKGEDVEDADVIRGHLSYGKFVESL